MCLHAQFWSLEAHPRRALTGHQLRCLTLGYTADTCTHTQSWPRMCIHPPSGSRVQHVYTCFHPLAYECSMCTHASTLWLTSAACVHIHPLAYECSMCIHPPSGSRAQHVYTSTLSLTSVSCSMAHLCKHHAIQADSAHFSKHICARTWVHALDLPSCRRVRKQNENFVRCSSARNSSLGLIFLYQSTLHSGLEWWQRGRRWSGWRKCIGRL